MPARRFGDRTVLDELGTGTAQCAAVTSLVCINDSGLAPDASSEVYAFGAVDEFGFEFEVDVAARELSRGGTTAHVEPKVFDLLVVLIRERHRVVPQPELIAQLWPDAVVCAGALHQCVAVLRRTLGDSGANARFVRTLHRRGYRFVAPVNARFGGLRAATQSAGPSHKSAHSGIANGSPSGQDSVGS